MRLPEIAKRKIAKWKIVLGLMFVPSAIYFSIPPPLTTPSTSYSSVLFSKEGELLDARVAKDFQWRFPKVKDTLPTAYRTSLVLFEDQYFRYHPGINPLAIVRAFGQNLESGKVISGGSTITMQLARMIQGNRARTYWRKISEIFLALRLELWLTKDEIIRAYASMAPFGGNVVGIEAAAWRYFSRPPESLSWAESAMLAVLPNAPSLLFPGKNMERLKAKRDALLQKLHAEDHIDSLTLVLSKAEAIPDKPLPLPGIASHFLDFLDKEFGAGQLIESYLPKYTQTRLETTINKHLSYLASHNIHNAALLVLDNTSQQVIGYVGNGSKSRFQGAEVDIVQSQRSTGSLLKPFLFGLALEELGYTPNSLIPDIPMNIAGFSPKNFFKGYYGAIPMNQALSKSLNVPFVHLLKEYGITKFISKLNDLGLDGINKSAHHYGLSLILGGGESSLWELTHAFASLANQLNPVTAAPLLRFQTHTGSKPRKSTSEYPINKLLCWETLTALLELKRPGVQNQWKSFSSAHQIAWKTGTSYGHRDAWAIGVTPEYTVGVWVGNANGEGKDGLTGSSVAGPIMLEAFDILKPEKWFVEPSRLIQQKWCSQSGFRASELCPKPQKLEAPSTFTSSRICPYHQRVFVSGDAKYQVNQNCSDGLGIQEKAWFVLPPIMGAYFRKNNLDYVPPPPFHHQCKYQGSNPIRVIYPERNSALFIPRELHGEKSRIILEASHLHQKAELFWHINDGYLGKTKGEHKLPVLLAPGKYVLKLMDEKGNALHHPFMVEHSN